jgi:hypothetical protein
MDLPRPTRQSSGAFPSAPGGRSDLQAFLPPFFGMLQSSSCVLGISWRTCIFRGRFVDIPHRGGLGLKLVSAPRTTPALFDIPRTGQVRHNLMRRAQSLVWRASTRPARPRPPAPRIGDPEQAAHRNARGRASALRSAVASSARGREETDRATTSRCYRPRRQAALVIEPPPRLLAP